MAVIINQNMPPKAHGFLEKGLVLSTPYKKLECFDTESEYLSRCDKLGIKKENEYDLPI